MTLSPQIKADERKEEFRDKLFELAICDFERNLRRFRKLYPVKTICMHGSPLSKWDNRDLWIELATKLRSASYARQADAHRLTQTFIRQTSPDKKSHRFARKIQNKLYKARVVGGEVAEALFNRGLCLPSGIAMTNDDLDRVIDTILNSRKKAQEC